MKTASFLLTIALVVFANTTYNGNLVKSEAIVSTRRFYVPTVTRIAETERKLESEVRTSERESERRTLTPSESRRHVIDNSRVRDSQDRRLVRETRERTIRDSREREDNRRVIRETREREINARRSIRLDNNRELAHDRENRQFAREESERRAVRETRERENGARRTVRESREETETRRLVRTSEEQTRAENTVRDVRHSNIERRSFREGNSERRFVRGVGDLSNNDRRISRETRNSANDRRTVGEIRESTNERIREVRDSNDRRMVKEAREPTSQLRSVRQERESSDSRSTVRGVRDSSTDRVRLTRLAPIKTPDSRENQRTIERKERIGQHINRSDERRLVLGERKDNERNHVLVGDPSSTREESQRFSRRDSSTEYSLFEKTFPFANKESYGSVSPNFGWNQLSGVMFGGAALLMIYAQNQRPKKVAMD